MTIQYNRLLAFGDSWPYGDELVGEEPFPFRIAEQLGWQCHNFSQSSTSIPHLIHQFQLATKIIINKETSISLQNENCCALFFLTSPSRDLRVYRANDSCIHYEEIAPNTENTKWYYQNMHSPEMDEYKTNTVILALLQLCAYHNVRPFFVWGWDTVPLWPEIDSKLFFPKTCLQMFCPNAINLYELRSKKDPHVWPNAGHPNSLGHTVIANNLASWIKKLTN